MRRISLLMAFAALVTAQPVLAEIGRIKSCVGDVRIYRDGRAYTAKPGVRVEEGDVIRTGSSGRVGITLLDNTRMALGPRSRIVLDEFKYDRKRQSGSSLTSVNRGSLGVVSGRIASSGKDAMKVRTPTSMLGVRGTRFVVEVP